MTNKQSLQALPSKNDFQVVLFTECDATVDNFYPLTEEISPCMLPIANRPILQYALELLDSYMFEEVFILVNTVEANTVTNWITNNNNFSNLKIITTLEIKEQQSTRAEVLRDFRARFTKDLILLSADIIMERCLEELIDFHRLRKCDATVLFKPVEKEVTKDKHSKAPKFDYAYLTNDDRFLQHVSADLLEHEEEPTLKISKYALKKYGSIKVRRDMLNSDVMILANWVLDLLVEKSYVGELLPYLLKHQLKDTNQPLKAATKKRADERIDERIHEEKDFDTILREMNSSSAVPESDEIITCYAYVLPVKDTFCKRITDLATYVSLNKDIALKSPPPLATWPAPVRANRKEQNLLHFTTADQDKNVKEASDALKTISKDKTINIRASIIGPGCTIEKQTGINNCIIMENVTIGEGCVLQNCIISAGCNIEPKCNLKQCQVGPNTRIKTGTKLDKQQVKNETTF